MSGQAKQREMGEKDRALLYNVLGSAVAESLIAEAYADAAKLFPKYRGRQTQ
jgi:hypothetical protein